MLTLAQYNLVRKAHKLIVSDLCYEYSLRELCRITGLKELILRVGLSDLYHGRTAHQCLVKARMDKAVKLLANTKKPIKDIAWKCGYGNPTNFANAFKKMFGKTPSAWRKYKIYGIRYGIRSVGWE